MIRWSSLGGVRVVPMAGRSEAGAQYLWITAIRTFGVWSGKVKVVNGSIHFLPRATKGLHDYDKYRCKRLHCEE